MHIPMKNITEQNEQVLAGFMQIGLLLRSYQWKKAEKHGLSATQVQVLTLLYHRGGSRIQELARLLKVTQATTSDAVIALENKGLIKKTADPTDGRAVLIILTDQGAELSKQLTDSPEILTQALSVLDLTEKGQFLRSMSKVLRTFIELGEIEPQRLCVTCKFFRPNIHNGTDKPHHCELVGAALGDFDLRLDCGEHECANVDDKNQNWKVFSKG